MRGFERRWELHDRAVEVESKEEGEEKAREVVDGVIKHGAKL